MASKKTNKFANKANEDVIETAAPVVEEKKEAAPVAEVAVKEAAVKETVAEKKPAEKKASEKKAAAKKAAAKDNAAEAKDVAKKSAAKSADKASKLVVQFAGKEYDSNDIVEMCKAAYKADNSRKQVRSIEVYVKPEESKAYYVVNGKAEGLFIEL